MRVFVALLVLVCAVAAGVALVRANTLSREYQKGEAEVRRSLPELVVLEKESLADRGMPVALDVLGYRPPTGSAYRYSATVAVIPTRRKIDVVLRAVRGGDDRLRGDVWETDCRGAVVHVVDRSREATLWRVLRSWVKRSDSDSPAIGLATPEAALADRKKREPSDAEARRDQELWIEFHSWDVEKGCCRAIGKDADLCCLSPLRILVNLQSRSHRIHAAAGENFPRCPAALALALADEPQSLLDPLTVASAAFASADPIRRAAGARLLGQLRDVVWTKPTAGFAALAPALGGTDIALFAPAATALASVEDRAWRLASGCRLADCSSALEQRQIEQARPLLREIESVIPAVRKAAPALLTPLVACASDPECVDRVGAAWALGQTGRPGRSAADPLIACLAAPPDGPLRGVAERSLIRIGSDDETVVTEVRDAAGRAPAGEMRNTLLGVLVHFPSARAAACTALAEDAVAHIGSVRNSAISVLGRAGSACGDVASSFAPFLKNASPFPRQESIRVLGLLGPSGKPYLQEALAAADLPAFSRLDLERALARTNQPDEPPIH